MSKIFSLIVFINSSLLILSLYFFISLLSSSNEITIPNQTLFQGLYTNPVTGVSMSPTNNSIHGTIISYNEFYTSYSILFSTGPKTYTCHYTRN